MLSLDGPQAGDGDTCPICYMPLISGECVRHDLEEMIQWANVYRRRSESRGSVIDQLGVTIDAAYRAIGTDEYLDPPDGGDVPLDEQIRRMRSDVVNFKARMEKHEVERDAAREEVNRLMSEMLSADKYAKEQYAAYEAQLAEYKAIKWDPPQRYRLAEAHDTQSGEPELVPVMWGNWMLAADIRKMIEDNRFTLDD
jgi:hypothetical protein